MDKWHPIVWISEWNNYWFIVKLSMFETNGGMTHCWQRKRNDREKLRWRLYKKKIRASFTAGSIQDVNMDALTGETVIFMLYFV